GAMCDNQQRSLEVPLKFLDPGRYRAEIYLDDEQAEYGLSRRTAEVTADDMLKIPMEPAGGFLARLIPK
ncbi:MAG: glycoside hydrolase family 97 C-terminal domain-containing protein, partial [Blastocatellia bacterium]|nr:glycoside hydrolase family 97 C-terminal domain-containing protein [Blastocatellia bacterium]